MPIVTHVLSKRWRICHCSLKANSGTHILYKKQLAVFEIRYGQKISDKVVNCPRFSVKDVYHLKQSLFEALQLKFIICNLKFKYAFKETLSIPNLILKYEVESINSRNGRVHSTIFFLTVSSIILVMRSLIPEFTSRGCCHLSNYMDHACFTFPTYHVYGLR